MAEFSFSRERAQDIACDLLVLPVFADLVPGPGVKEVEAALGLSLTQIASGSPQLGERKSGFSGALGDAVIVQSLGRLPAAAVLLVGMGDKAAANANTARKAGAVAARRSGQAKNIATTIVSAVRGGPDAAVAAFVEGFLLASYRYERYKSTQNGKPNSVETIALVADKKWDVRALRKQVDRAQIIAEGTNLARDLTNTPSGDKSPETLAEEARRIAKAGNLKVKVLDEKELAAKGFGGILGVGRGSPQPPRLIELRYEPAGAKRTISIIGKGITFDSGGLNLKGSDGIDWMKMDMGGAGAVLGAMHVISKLKPKVAVRGYIATAENMPDGNALHPGDVITQYGGITVEIGNTDAEGRLVMADALVYARERGTDVLVDIATLTGACVVALGNKMFGVIGEPRAEVKKMLDASARAGEKAWELPLERDYMPVMKSDIADLRNHRSKDVGAGTILAALFLKEFVGDTPWVHIDIAGAAKSDAEEFENPKWATGAGVRTLVEYVMSQ